MERWRRLPGIHGKSESNPIPAGRSRERTPLDTHYCHDRVCGVRALWRGRDKKRTHL